MGTTSPERKLLPTVKINGEEFFILANETFQLAQANIQI
jgi:hypothetical protein